MTDKEIKKAWNQMKKELKKEYPNVPALGHGFTMSGKQLNLRTATFLGASVLSYDWHIEYYEKTTIRVMGYHSWTQEEKEKCKKENAGYIAEYMHLKEMYGTPENEVREYMRMIKESKAFKKFADTVGNVTLRFEETKDGYYVRFMY